MGAIGGILLVAGIVALIWGAMQKYKSGRLSTAPFVKTGEAASNGQAVANPKGALSVEGDVQCPQPLISPVTGTPCLYYELKVVGSWKEGDTNKTKEYLVEKKAAPFAIDDGSSPVPVAAQDGGDFDPFVKTFDETKKEGFFADLKNALGKKEPIQFGQFSFENPPMSKADKFTCTERVMKVQPRLFALGSASSGVVAPPKWTSLILSNKSRDELLGHTAKAAKNFLVGGGVAAGVGLVLGVVASLISPKVKAEAPQAAVIEQAKPLAPAEEAEPSDVCAQAVRCCKALDGAGTSACDGLAKLPEENCTKSLASFKKAVKASRPKRLSQCN